MPLPQRYIENHEWNIEIISAPECPKVQNLRLIKTSPFNFELRSGFLQTPILFVDTLKIRQKKLYAKSYSKSRYWIWGNFFPGRERYTCNWFQWYANWRFKVGNWIKWWLHRRRLCGLVPKSNFENIFWLGYSLHSPVIAINNGP